MALERPLAAAFIDGGARQRCLGVTMLPFSVWHLFLLNAIDSPLVQMGEVELHDLRMAVGICRLKFPDSKIVRPRLMPWVVWRLCQKGGLIREVLRFVEYTGDYLSKPEYGIIPPKMKGGGSGPKAKPGPELMLLMADVIGWAGWNREVAFNLSVGEAKWWQAMALRAKGLDVDFQTDRERTFEEQMKAAGKQPADERTLKERIAALMKRKADKNAKKK